MLSRLTDTAVLASVLCATICCATPISSKRGECGDALPEVTDSSVDISDRYIVTLKPGTDVSQHLSHVQDFLHADFTKSHEGKVFEGVTHEYDLPDIRAYAGHFDSAAIDRLRTHDDIVDIEKDQIWALPDLTPSASYGLSLISHRGAGPDNAYFYDSTAGSSTFAYVIDSGINTAHPEFESRASLGYNAIGSFPFKDTDGHGTHVAGIIGSKTYGVAKKCRLIAVKAFERDTGMKIRLMDAYGWAVNDILERRRQSKAVINISASVPYSKALNQMVDEAFRKGVTTVCSAGNKGKRASERSPGSAESAITVGATDARRQRVVLYDWKSNWGPAVKIYAPGLGIRSTWHGSMTWVGSGTSQASAYVAGVVVYLKRLEGLDDARSTMTRVLHLASKGIVGDPKGGWNLFVYNGSGK
ncbi:subtilisin-like protein [Myriangium duriaei CBS 260.36]|uniref:Subtilisin-like protein n=1 Tax=Myriangium duriaei CBS 260.36 TaxID=1168546 RepID=A0A9P4IR06_9PEZI|nr:subtilisin-like protein [Myriangium duriaei CBS 260.36]